MKKMIPHKALLILFMQCSMMIVSFSQVTPERCATQKAMEDFFMAHPGEKDNYNKTHEDALSYYKQRMNVVDDRIQQRNTSASEIVLPVVVHIILTDPTVVSDAQVLSQLDALNEDFSGTNADTSLIPFAFKPLIGKSKIRFCLARRDPDGLPTTGIIRKSGNTRSSVSYNDPVKYSTKGGSDAWDPKKYINIWVVVIPNDILGYSFLPGIPSLPETEAGIVMQYTNFGRTGTARPPYNKGRTCTHEMGHYLDLLHIWGSGSCEASCRDDDEVDDTPLQEKCFYGIPTFPQLDACSENIPGVMFMNFMDYVDDASMQLFSSQQAGRMEDALEFYPDRSTLLNSDGCKDPQQLERDVELREFLVPNKYEVVCSTATNPVFTFRNRGTTILTTIEWVIQIDNSTPQVLVSNGLNLASLAYDTLTLPSSSLSPGIHSYFIYSRNPNGLADENPINDTLRSHFQVKSVAMLPLEESFESNVFPPVSWNLYNPDFNYTWERTQKASSQGSYSMYLNSFNYSTTDPVDEIRSALLAVPQADSIYLEFDVASAMYTDPSSVRVPYDTLEVLLSTDCGNNWIKVYKKGGTVLETTGTGKGISIEFIPTENQWRREKINLTRNINNSSTFEILFRVRSQFENNIYLDKINIDGIILPDRLKLQGYLVYPNPFRDKLIIRRYPDAKDLFAIQVFNSTGQRVYSHEMVPGFASPYQSLDLSHLASGIYFVRLIGLDINYTQQVIKLP